MNTVLWIIILALLVGIVARIARKTESGIGLLFLVVLTAGIIWTGSEFINNINKINEKVKQQTERKQAR